MHRLELMHAARSTNGAWPAAVCGGCTGVSTIVSTVAAPTRSMKHVLRRPQRCANGETVAWQPRRRPAPCRRRRCRHSPSACDARCYRLHHCPSTAAGLPNRLMITPFRCRDGHGQECMERKLNPCRALPRSSTSCKTRTGSCGLTDVNVNVNNLLARHASCCTPSTA